MEQRKHRDHDIVPSHAVPEPHLAQAGDEVAVSQYNRLRKPRRAARARQESHTRGARRDQRRLRVPFAAKRLKSDRARGPADYEALGHA